LRSWGFKTGLPLFDHENGLTLFARVGTWNVNNVCWAHEKNMQNRTYIAMFKINHRDIILRVEHKVSRCVIIFGFIVVSYLSI
jgi:hypothetical protein